LESDRTEGSPGIGDIRDCARTEGGGVGRGECVGWAGLGWAELLGLFIGRDASRAIFIHGLASQ
jgi:hypothetical protein